LHDLATRQHGVVAFSQLRGLGFSQRAVARRVGSGRFHRLYRGVYAVGHRRITREGRWLAAVFGCGPDALLSHRAAAVHQGLARRPLPRIDVIVPRQVRAREGVRIHRSACRESDRAIVDSIPCTGVPRTLLDLAAVGDPALEAAISEAERRSLLDALSIEDLLARSPGRAGAWRLREALAAYFVEATWTRSELERRFLGHCAEAGLPRPRVNVWVPLRNGGVEVDFSWPEQRLVVETDGHATHRSRDAFEADRRRDQQLMVAGWRVARFTWHQVAHERELVIETLRRLLVVAS
jgi:predicted transcriptional regulator of viral defense system